MMDPALAVETENLRQSWMRYDAATLRDYLVADVEDPRLNLQSILTRHFLARALHNEGLDELMREEYRFSAVMNALLPVLRALHDPEEWGLVRYALERGSDNAEGIAIPLVVLDAFKRLPAEADGLMVPNYIEALLAGSGPAAAESAPFDPHPTIESALNTFAPLWTEALTHAGRASTRPTNEPLPTVLEPACGSANDYRYLRPCGLGQRFAYTGFDLCPTNIENARALFPNVPFQVGNVFELEFPDRAFDVCFVHDLFEHLSLAGLEQSVGELCRVTRQAMCLHFFNMDEVHDHRVRPVEDYHWNLLSMARVKDLLAERGFESRVLHIGTFLRQETGAESTHNPNAYTFITWRARH